MKKWSILAVVFLLSACVGAKSSPSHFYQLQAASEVSPLSERRLDVGVEEAFVPKYLDRPQIVTMTTDSSELKMSEFYRWAEPLSSAFSRVLADDISSYLPKSVIKYKTLGSEDFTYTITVEINKINAVLGQKLEVDAWWTVYKGNNTALRDRSRLSVPLGDSYESLADGLSGAINEMARQIAVKLSKL